MLTTRYEKPRDDVKLLLDRYSMTRAEHIAAYVGERTPWRRAAARNWALFYGKMRRKMMGVV